MTKKSARRPLVAGNWKMNKDHVEAVRLMADLGLRIRTLGSTGLDVSVHPPFTDLRTVATIIGAEGLPIILGAQHCSAKSDGAFTGEVSVSMLSRLGVQMVIVGHSERRQFYAMTDDVVSETVRAVHGGGMTAVICVGETQHEREAGITQQVLETQMTGALDGVLPGTEERTVIAYEPIWAIGTGLAASGEDAQAVCGSLRSMIRTTRSELADSVRILYGGSAKSENAAEYVSQVDIDGLLVGGASLEGESFAAILQAVDTCYGFSAS